MIRGILVAMLLGCAGSDPVPTPIVSVPTPLDTDSPPSADADTTTTPPVLDTSSCDGGDAAWVQRVIPLLWGRRAHGSAEIQLWSEMATAYGRETTARAMTHNPIYARWWRSWLTDAMYVARNGDKEDDDCFQAPLLDNHDGSLAAFIRDNPPYSVGYGTPYNMADVLTDALVLDDLSVAYKAHLFARMNKPVQGANVPADEMEYNRRVNFGELFFNTYLGRNLTCIVCHNSEYSVTDDADPTLDRTWQIKGLFELAMLGASDGGNVDEHYAMFRYEALVGDSGTTVWGMSDACGTFNGPASFGEDFLGQETAFFIDAYDSTGSVWDLAEQLDGGVDKVSDGLYVNGDATVDGQEGFAYLLAAHVSDLVWQQAFGQRLTIAHGFARNEPQGDRLQALADSFAASRFSLRELLVDVVTDPLFNAGGPFACESDLYGLDAVINPWSIAEEDPALTGNGAGDLVHRQTARVLLRTAYDQLGWGAPPEWDLSGDDEDLLAAIGAFLRESEPGFNGSDFQGVLAFEERFGSCANPFETPDAIDQLLATAVTTDAPVGELVAALKDRLFGDGTVAPDEQPLIEALLLHTLDTPLSATTAEFDSRFRLLCGALLLSPDWTLAVDPPVPGPIPPLAANPTRDCWDLMVWMAEENVTIDCGDFGFVP